MLFVNLEVEGIASLCDDITSIAKCNNRDLNNIVIQYILHVNVVYNLNVNVNVPDVNLNVTEDVSPNNGDDDVFNIDIIQSVHILDDYVQQSILLRQIYVQASNSLLLSDSTTAKCSETSRRYTSRCSSFYERSARLIGLVFVTHCFYLGGIRYHIYNDRRRILKHTPCSCSNQIAIT